MDATEKRLIRYRQKRQVNKWSGLVRVNAASVFGPVRNTSCEFISRRPNPCIHSNTSVKIIDTALNQLFTGGSGWHTRARTTIRCKDRYITLSWFSSLVTRTSCDFDDDGWCPGWMQMGKYWDELNWKWTRANLASEMLGTPSRDCSRSESG